MKLLLVVAALDLSIAGFLVGTGQPVAAFIVASLGVLCFGLSQK